MSESDLERLIDSLPRSPRYGSKKGAVTLKDAAMLAMQFGGDASSIWKDASPSQVEKRLRQIYGVGSGIAHMAIRILHDHYGVFVGQEKDIDVKPDTHIVRVFKRTGLTLYESEDEAVRAARQLNPQYPAELDWPAWIIGQEWCRPSNPNCSPCPLTSVCPKLLD
jgi:endonuclease III